MSVQISYKKQTTLGIILLLILFLAIEAVANVWWNFQIECEFEENEIFQNMNESQKRQMCVDLYEMRTSGSELIPNQSSETININSFGFRGDEFSINKSDDEYRIFMLGGSTMFGTGATSDDTTIPGYLQNILENKFNQNIQVINAGIQAADSDTEISLIENKLKKFSADLMIIYDGWNDLRASNDAEKVFSNWNKMCQIGKENNFEVIVTLQPIAGFGNKILTKQELDYSTNGEDYAKKPLINSLNKYEKYAGKLLELKTCMGVIDLRNIFDNEIQPIYWDQGHVSDVGNKIVATGIYQEISQKNYLEIKSSANQILELEKNNSSEELQLEKLLRSIISHYKTPVMISHIFSITSIESEVREIESEVREIESEVREIESEFTEVVIESESVFYNDREIVVNIEFSGITPNNTQDMQMGIFTYDKTNGKNIENVTYFLSIIHEDETLLREYFFVEDDYLLFEIGSNFSEEIKIIGEKQYAHNAYVMNKSQPLEITGSIFNTNGVYEFRIDIRTMDDPSVWIFDLNKFNIKIDTETYQKISNVNQMEINTENEDIEYITKNESFEENDTFHEYSEIVNEKTRTEISDYPNNFNISYIDQKAHKCTNCIENLNEQGLRGKSFSQNKSDEIFRIIAVGGSTTYGDGLHDDETWPEQLQKMYDGMELDLQIEVINAGIPAGHSTNESQLIKKKLVNFQPDLVIMYDGWNDTVYNDVETTMQNWETVCKLGREKGFETIIVVQPIVGTGKRILTQQEVTNYMVYTSETMADIYLLKIDKLNVLTNKLFSNSQSSCVNSYDFRTIFDHIYEPIYWDRGHPNAQGNEIIAKKMLQVLAEFLDFSAMPDDIVEYSHNPEIKSDISGVFAPWTNLSNQNMDGLDLRNSVFYSSDLNNIVFENSDLSGSDFRFANIKDVNFKNSNIEDVKFDFAKFDGIDILKEPFNNIELKTIDLSSAILNNIDLSNRDLTFTNLSGQDLSDYNFINTKLDKTDLSYTKLPPNDMFVKKPATVSNVILNGVDLSKTDLTKTHFFNIKLDNSNLQNSNLHETIFRDVNFSNIKNKSLEYTEMYSTEIIYSNLQGIKFPNEVFSSNFYKSNLSDVNFSNSKIKFGVFNDSILKNANFENVHISGHDFFSIHENELVVLTLIRQELRDKLLFGMEIFVTEIMNVEKVNHPDARFTHLYFTSFLNADLTNSNFQNASLQYVNMNKAELTNTNFVNADLRGAFLIDANLEGANLEGANLEGANLEGANLNCINHEICNKN